MKVVVGGKVIGNGKASFHHLLHVCVENQQTAKQRVTRTVNSKKGKGTVGVRPEMYLPPLTKDDATAQKSLRDKLQQLHSDEDPSLWGWQ